MQTKEEIHDFIKSLMKNDDGHIYEDDDGNERRSYYLGTYMSLDPCGKYHHTLSPNSITPKCIEFWENLEEVTTNLGGWIESGEGDPCDIYFVM